MRIDSEELVKRMKAFGLKGVRDGSVHFFIKPELLAEFLEAEIRAELDGYRELGAKAATLEAKLDWEQRKAGQEMVERLILIEKAQKLEAENKQLREALEKTVIEWHDYTPGTHFARLKAALDKEYKP